MVTQCRYLPSLLAISEPCIMLKLFTHETGNVISDHKQSDQVNDIAAFNILLLPSNLELPQRAFSVIYLIMLVSWLRVYVHALPRYRTW